MRLVYTASRRTMFQWSISHNIYSDSIASSICIKLHVSALVNACVCVTVYVCSSVRLSVSQSVSICLSMYVCLCSCAYVCPGEQTVLDIVWAYWQRELKLGANKAPSMSLRRHASGVAITCCTRFLVSIIVNKSHLFTDYDKSHVRSYFAALLLRPNKKHT